MNFKFVNMTFKILWENLTNRYWLIPTLTSLVIIACLPIALLIQNTFFTSSLSKMIFTGYSAEAGRMILSSIATALMTVIGVLFSITIVVIQQASAQYSPRVIEIFIKARNSQFTLGFYVGTFVYCILLLRQVPTAQHTSQIEIPQTALSLALALALCCIGLLVQYVHFIAHSIKSTHIIDSIIKEALSYLDSFQKFMASHKSTSPSKNFGHSHAIRAEGSGYFQNFKPESLTHELRSTKSLVQLAPKVGDYIQQGDLIAEIFSDVVMSDYVHKKITKVFKLGLERTHAQDIRYSLRQLADIALRALSPGINDPSTAIEALHGIETLFLHYIKHCQEYELLELSEKTSLRYNSVCFNDVMTTAFNQILVFSKDHIPVLLEIRSILRKALNATIMKEREAILLAHLRVVDETLGECQGIELYHALPERRKNMDDVH